MTEVEVKIALFWREKKIACSSKRNKKQVLSVEKEKITIVRRENKNSRYRIKTQKTTVVTVSHHEKALARSFAVFVTKFMMLCTSFDSPGFNEDIVAESYPYFAALKQSYYSKGFNNWRATLMNYNDL